MNGLLQDLRHGIRALSKSPGFTLAAVLTLALGIGANTAVFSVVDAVVLRPLPYADSDRLYLLAEQTREGVLRLGSYPNFEDYRAQSSLWTMAFALGDATRLRGERGTERRLAARVSEGWFEVLGARPLLGRLFWPDEERAGAVPPAVLTHRLWQERFGADPGVLGRTLQFADGPYVVVGVLPRGVGYPSWAELYTPLAAAPAKNKLDRRDVHVDSRVVARLRGGADPERARAELELIGRRLASAYPAENAGWGPAALPLVQDVVGGARPQLLLLLAAVGLVLLVACANVANLCLARAASRQRELAVRAALGASRLRLARHLGAETAAVALAGGILGLVAAAWGVGALVHLGRDAVAAAAGDLLPRLDEVTVDARVLAFTAGMSLLTALIAGLGPALHAGGIGLAAALRKGGRYGSSSAAGPLRRGLVVMEVALAAALLVGAGLVLTSFRNVGRVDPGFDPEGVLAVRMLPPSPTYDDGASDVLPLYRRLAMAAAGVPGVVGTALVNHLPLSGTSITSRVEIAGREMPEEGESVGLRTVSEGYFETLAVRILAGRSFTAADMTPSDVVAAVVSEALVRRYWPGQNPIGRGLTVFKSAPGRSDFGRPVAARVVGVAADVQHFSLEQAPEAVVYLPYTANAWTSMYLAVRAEGRPEALLESLRRALLAAEPDVTLVEAGTLESNLSRTLAPRAFTTALLVAFAAAALLLAALGLYGVLAYLVGRRTREIGIRMALGARGGDVVRQVVGQALALVALGLAAGAGGALLLTRLLRGLLFGVGPADPLTFVGVAALLAAVGLAASGIPARRAARVDPALALRSE